MPKYRLGMCVTSRLLQAFTRPSFRFSPLWNIVSVAAMFSSVFVTERCKQAMQAWVNANLQGRTNLTLYVHSTKSQSLLLYLKSGLVTEQRDCGQYWTLWKRNVSSPRGWKIEPLTPTVRGSDGYSVRAFCCHGLGSLGRWDRTVIASQIIIYTNYSVLSGMVSPGMIGHEAPLNALMTVNIITQRHRISEYLGDFERLSNHQAPT